MCAVPRRMIFCSSFILLVPGIFPKFWSIPSLISPSAPTITGTVSVLIPHILVVSISRSLYFESFSMTFVEVIIIIIIIITIITIICYLFVMYIFFAPCIVRQGVLIILYKLLEYTPL